MGRKHLPCDPARGLQVPHLVNPERVSTILGQWCNKSIPMTRDSFNEPGVIGGIVESAAKLFDRSIQTLVEIDKGVLGPPGSPKDLCHSLPRPWSSYPDFPRLRRQPRLVQRRTRH